MGKEINKTREQKSNQATPIIRKKKKKRKKDLDQVRRRVLDTRNKKLSQRYSGGKILHCKVENSARKTLNNFARVRQNNDDETKGLKGKDGEQMKQKTVCERLLPQPGIGIYRNGISSKQIKKPNKISLFAKNGRQPPGDVMKLLNGEGPFSKKSEDVRVSEENELISGNTKYLIGLKTNQDQNNPAVTRNEELHRKSIDDKDEADLINKMNSLGKGGVKSSDTKCNYKALDLPSEDSLRNEIDNREFEELQHSSVQKNLKSTSNAEVGSVRRWRWSPVTCFEEFCAKICLEHFVNRPIEGSPDPVKTSRMILQDFYSVFDHADCDYDLLSKNPTTREFFKSFSTSPDKTKQNPENGKSNMKRDMITPEYENERFASRNPVITDDVNTKFPVKPSVTEKSKETRKSKSSSLPTEAQHFTDFTEISKNFVDPRKIKEFDCRPSNGNCSSKYDRKYYEELDHLSQKAVPFVLDKFNNDSTLPSTANSDIVKWLENGQFEMIQTPSTVEHMIRNNKIFSNRKLNHPKASYKGNKSFVNKDNKKKQVNGGKFEMKPKGILKNISDDLCYHINDRDLSYDERNKSNDTQFYEKFSQNYFQHSNDEFASQQKWMGKSLKCVKNNAPYELIDKPLEFRLDYTESWQNKSYNKKHNYGAEGKVFPCHDDYFNQVNQLTENKTMQHSKQMQQPRKYFAVENYNNSVDCPQRIALHRHEYQYNNEEYQYNEDRNPYNEFVNSGQVIEPSLTVSPVVMFNQTNQFKSGFHAVNAVNKEVRITQSGRNERSEVVSPGWPWIHDQAGNFLSPKYSNNQRNNNDQTRIVHLNQTKHRDNYSHREFVLNNNKSYYFH